MMRNKEEVMENIIGVGQEKLEDLEQKLVNEKIKFLDEYCTFGCDKYDSEYLLKLNNFLFGDLYGPLCYRLSAYNGIIDSYLHTINEEGTGNKNIEVIFQRLQALWELQPFLVGNTRTFAAFIKIINEAYNLKLEIDPNTELYSGMNLFDIVDSKKK